MGAKASQRLRCTWRFRLRFRIFIDNRGGGGGGGGGNEERNGFPISILVSIPFASPITTLIFKDLIFTAVRAVVGALVGAGGVVGHEDVHPRDRQTFVNFISLLL